MLKRSCRLGAASLALLLVCQACDLFVETTTPVSFGMVRGKVVGWADHNAHMIDLGSVYRPESGTVILVAAVGPDHEQRREWVVEAECSGRSFVRGVGPTPFVRWPAELAAEAVELACSTEAPEAFLEHPLERLSAEEREAFVYWEGFDEKAAADLVNGVNYWARKRAKQTKAP